MQESNILKINSISTSPKPVSKKIHRVAVGILFFVHGLCFASWASRIPSIQQKLNLSETALGGVLLALPIGLMASLPIAGWLVAKFTSRKVAIPASVLYSLALIGIGYSQNITQLVCCLVFYGFAGNMVNIAINTQAVGVEALYKKSIMASFHGLWSLAGFSGAAIGTWMISLGTLPLKHFYIIAILNFLLILGSSQYILKTDANSDTNQRVFTWPDKSLINLGFITFCAMICEGAMFDWSGVYFKKVILAEAGWVGAGYTAFMATMALSRFLADWVTSKLGLKRVLQLSGLLTALGLLIAVVIPSLVTGIIGFLLVGAGISSVVPLVYGAAGRSTIMSPGVAIAAVSTIGFLGFLIGPPVIGFIAGASSLRMSFILIAFMGMMVALLATKTNLAEK